MIIDIPDEERKLIAEGMKEKERGRYLIGPANMTSRMVYVEMMGGATEDPLRVSRKKGIVEKWDVGFGNIYVLTKEGEKKLGAVRGYQPK